MALLQRVKTPEWQNGDILTHTDLIAEFSNIINGLNGANDISVLDITCDDITGDVFTANSLVCNTFTGNANVSGTANIVGNAVIGGTLIVTGVVTSPQLELGRVDNLGISLASGVLKIVDASGANLSATNYGFITMQSTTAGRQVSLKVNSNGLSIQDAAGTSDFTNLEWGVTNTTDWAQDVPFFLYAVNKGNNNITGSDGDSAFALAKNPALKVTPSNAANIGDTAAIAATDDQFAIMLLGSYTEANYLNLPVQLVGAIRMRYATATKDWTIQTLSATSDGLGPEQLRKCFATTWTMPTAQMGASTGTHFRPNGGTAPVFTTQLYTYKVYPDGLVKCEFAADADGGTDGAGAVQAQLSIPYNIKMWSTAGFARIMMGATTGATTITGIASTMGSLTDNDPKIDLTYSDTSLTTANITNAMFSNGGRTCRYRFEYPAY